MKKADLRNEYLERRASVPTSAIRNGSEAVASRFFSSFDLSQVRCIHVFLTVEERGEVETSLFVKTIWRSYPHITVVVPRINRKEKKMECAVYDPMSRLVPNFWGIFEPLNTRTLPATAVDVVLVPLLCFDKTGHRVGYGGGYYDKFLAICRDGCLKVGLSLFDPIEKIEEVEEHDIVLDHCVTPEKIWSFDQ